MTRCSELRLSLGAYALGTLEPADEREVEAHLATCAACLAEVDELAAVVPSLSLVTADDLPVPEPAAELFGRIAGAVEASTAAGAADRHGRRRAAPRAGRRWLLAAAGVVVLAGGGAAAGLALADSSHPSSTSTVRASAGGVHLAVAASDARHGTRLVLTVSGLPAHERCHLVALAADGTMHDAGRWDASYEGAAKVVEATSVSRSQLRGLTLYGNGGRQLVQLNV